MAVKILYWSPHYTWMFGLLVSGTLNPQCTTFLGLTIKIVLDLGYTGTFKHAKSCVSVRFNFVLQQKNIPNTIEIWIHSFNGTIWLINSPDMVYAYTISVKLNVWCQIICLSVCFKLWPQLSDPTVAGNCPDGPVFKWWSESHPVYRSWSE